jgi:hypothetical protein
VLYGRGLAKQKHNDPKGGAADIMAAKKLDPDVVKDFAGLVAK